MSLTRPGRLRRLRIGFDWLKTLPRLPRSLGAWRLDFRGSFTALSLLFGPGCWSFLIQSKLTFGPL
jgi:hypothetical protein